MDQPIHNRELKTDPSYQFHYHDQNVDCVINVIKELPSLAERKSVTQQQIQSLHGLGYQLYEAQCYEEAGDLFRFLCFFESKVPGNWVALGGAYQHTKHHDNALAAFTMACLLDPNHPEPRFYAAHTLIDLQELPLALQSINIAIELCQGYPKYRPLYRRSIALRNAITMHLNKYGIAFSNEEESNLEQ